MAIDQGIYLTLLWQGLILGAVLGIVYDVFRILRIALRPLNREKEQSVMAIGGDFIRTLFLDLAFGVIAAFSVTVLFFAANDGIIRWFGLAAVVAGFGGYQATAGRLVARIAETLIFWIKSLILWVFRLFFDPILFLIRLIFFLLYDRILKRAQKRTNVRRQKQVLDTLAAHDKKEWEKIEKQISHLSAS